MKVIVPYVALSFVGVLGSFCIIPAMVFLLLMGDVKMAIAFSLASVCGVVSLIVLYRCGFSSRYNRLVKAFPDPDLQEDPPSRG